MGSDVDKNGKWGSGGSEATKMGQKDWFSHGESDCTPRISTPRQVHHCHLAWDVGYRIQCASRWSIKARLKQGKCYEISPLVAGLLSPSTLMQVLWARREMCTQQQPTNTQQHTLSGGMGIIHVREYRQGELAIVVTQGQQSRQQQDTSVKGERRRPLLQLQA